MPPQRLMLIRHGEKQPDSGPPPYGVDAAGNQNEHSLTSRGWQRAGALVPFFRDACAPAIKTPDAVYASKVGATVVVVDGQNVSESLRPQQTVTPLVEAIAPAKGLQTPFAIGEEAQLAQTILSHEDGIVLVAWEHSHIPIIAQSFTTEVPDSWSRSCFDAVWVLKRSKRGGYVFKEVRQALLAGDRPP
jgi:hypothetical protein